MSYTVVDDFLRKEEFDTLYTLIAGNGYFPWFSGVNGVAYPGDPSDKYFTHTFYVDYRPNSSNFEVIKPILNMLNIKALIRAKANWYTKNSKLIEHGKHADFPFDHNAFILYLNTNNRFTRMSDGTVVNSIANRALFFNGNELHNSTNCTDELFRINIAINYF
jgi:hypothetical protein